MAGQLSIYADNKLLDHVFKTTSYTPPTNIYIALSTSTPNADGTGVTEPTGNGYARTVCNTWTAASARAAPNTNAVTFPAATGSWGTITYYVVYDASTSGHMLGYGSLTTPNSVVSGNVVSFAAGQIILSFNAGGISTALANKLIDHILKTTAYTVPTNIYVGLSTANPTDAGSGITEPSGNAYARTVMNTWDAASASATGNTGAIIFPTATGSWGTVTYGLLFDAITSGNFLGYAALGTSQAVVSGNVVEFDVDALAVTLT